MIVTAEKNGLSEPCRGFDKVQNIVTHKLAGDISAGQVAGMGMDMLNKYIRPMKPGMGLPLDGELEVSYGHSKPGERHIPPLRIHTRR